MKAADFWRQAARQRREISRLCPLEWGSGCLDHGGREHRCVRYDCHPGEHECECLETTD